MKILLCIALLFGGCVTPIKSYKKPDNIIKQENLQENFDKIDKNNDGVIDKSEAKEHEESKPAKADPEAPMWAFFQILAFMALACIVTWTCTFTAERIRDFRQKKRI